MLSIGYMKLTWENTLPATDSQDILLNKLSLDSRETHTHYGQRWFEKSSNLPVAAKKIIDGWKGLRTMTALIGFTSDRVCCALETPFSKALS
ncbi:hypothetical protein INP82_10560 [Citrobacter sedlakii]|uniref:hypothetical protein n=1 Tax=Citrobacter TaxID=544 RepID=UPI00196A03E7|nr:MULTISPECIES: hypothetical protein [Citrobacter]MBM9567864.1 hypothetical protein [Citrobacter sedlakii]HBL4690534.1 hypothetical protein [Citrobacter sedlakii]